jgi:hypothetical protein
MGPVESAQPTNKESIVDDILSLPAVAMRGDRDELIEYVEGATPPLQWKKEARDMLMVTDEGYLRMLRNLIEKRIEDGKKPYG